MKRMYPERSYGKFLCCDGMNHDWFMPLIKTFVHYLKALFWDQELHVDLTHLVQKPRFLERSQVPIVTWLGHSTFLIQVADKNILTDPIFGSLSSVFRRLVPPVVSVEDLPPIDYVLISHNHFDHMDSKSLCSLKTRFPRMRTLVPMGDKDWFDRHLFQNVSEHMWWDEIVDSKDPFFKCTFLPANHWSQRTLFDKNRSLWGSWMIQSGDFTLYFGGDTSWGTHFKQIGHEFKHIDVALLPIAPGEPRSWMKETHINAQEAVQAFVDLKAHMLIPMHWGTFHLGFDEFHAPIDLLKESWHGLRQQLQTRKLKILKFGEFATDLSQKLIISVVQKTTQATL